MTKRKRSVHLPERQWELLEQEAKRLGLSVSELIRLIIHQYLEGRDL